jgi:hypothetical protein
MVIQPVLRSISINIKCHMTMYVRMQLDSKIQLVRLFLLLLSVFREVFSCYLNHHMIYFIFKITMTHYACIPIWVSGISSCLIEKHCTIHTSTIYRTHKAIKLLVYSLLKPLLRVNNVNLLKPLLRVNNVKFWVCLDRKR